MKVAVIGSRNICIEDIGEYLPENTSEIVTGGAKGADSFAEQYAKENKIPIKIFLPEYERYKKAAPIKRNMQIIEYSDTVVALWDGKSKGTAFVINECKKQGKPLKVYLIK